MLAKNLVITFDVTQNRPNLIETVTSPHSVHVTSAQSALVTSAHSSPVRSSHTNSGITLPHQTIYCLYMFQQLMKYLLHLFLLLIEF